MEIQKNFSLKELNTFGIDAKAKYFISIENEDQLKAIFSDSKYTGLSKLVLGGGSNILLTNDYTGMVIKISIPGINVIDEDTNSVLIEAGGGVVWHDLVKFAVKNDFGGLEKLSLIPGTVGAAPVQNIGAYGQELKNVFHSLTGINIEKLSFEEMLNADCQFEYRDSIFKQELKNKFIITRVKIKLQKHPDIRAGLINSSEINTLHELLDGYDFIKDVSEKICKIRQSKLPDPKVLGNSGSFFKNPVVANSKYLIIKEKFPDVVGYEMPNNQIKISAGWLIEQCGWKGKRVGNVGVYEKQALVLVNYGNATGKEVLTLAENIKLSVQDSFGILLEEEVRII